MKGWSRGRTPPPAALSRDPRELPGWGLDSSSFAWCHPEALVIWREAVGAADLSKARIVFEHLPTVVRPGKTVNRSE